MSDSMVGKPVYIAAKDLAAALEARGIACTRRSAQNIVTMRKLPFFQSPIGRGLVITPEMLDDALIAPAVAAERAWKANREAERKSSLLGIGGERLSKRRIFR